MIGTEIGVLGVFVLLLVVVGALILLLYLVPIPLWIAAWASGAYVGLFSLIGMRFRRVPPGTVVTARISAVKAGLEYNLCAARVPLCTPNPTFSQRSTVSGLTRTRSRTSSRCRHALRMSLPCSRNALSSHFLRVSFMRAARSLCVKPLASRNSFIVLPESRPVRSSPTRVSYPYRRPPRSLEVRAFLFHVGARVVF